MSERDTIVSQFTNASHQKFDARCTRHINANNGYISEEIELTLARLVLDEQENPEKWSLINS